MSSLQHIYDQFCTGLWAEHDEATCPCRGSGWALSDVDTLHKCGIHYAGQRHPEDDGDFSDDMDVQVVLVTALPTPADLPVFLDLDSIPF